MDESGGAVLSHIRRTRRPREVAILPSRGPLISGAPVFVSAPSATNVTVEGDMPDARNLISGNGSGVFINNSTSTEVEGNPRFGEARFTERVTLPAPLSRSVRILQDEDRVVLFPADRKPP
jgi:hypothetical protein